MNRLICVTLLLVALSGLQLSQPATAADSDIVIRRDIQPRVAGRTEMVPDPNPTVANASPEATVRQSVPTGSSGVEISDSDFSRVISGSSLTSRLVPALQAGGLQTDLNPGRSISTGTGASHSGSGGATRGIAGQISNGLQQGLRPLQSLGGR